MLSKVVIPSLVLVSAGNALVSSNGFDVTKCQGSYQEQVQFLYLNCEDANGKFVERYQRLFTRPLVQECSQVSRSSVLLPASSNSSSGSNSTSPSNSTSGMNTTTPVDNSTAGSNTTTPVDNSTAGSNSSTGSNTTTSVNNSTTVVDNSTTVVDNSTDVPSSGRRLQGEISISLPIVIVDLQQVDNSTTGGDNSTVPVMNSTAPVDNSTAPVDNSTAGSNTTTPVDNSTAGSNSTENGGGVVAADQVNCCDFYEQGAGYEFSVCDGNIGAVIRQSLIGGERDRYWAMQQPSSFLGPVWTDLNNLVNNYCDNRAASAVSSSNSTNSTNATGSSGNSTVSSAGNVSATQIWSQLDLPWAQWKDEAALEVSNLWAWLSRYQQYLGQAEQYISMPAGSGNASSTNLTGVSYGSLVTDYQSIYSGFIEWYNLFFGQDGLISVNQTTVYDGSVPVYQWKANITSFEDNQGVDLLEVERPFDLPYQMESIAEWINFKFGGIILENSCRICNGQTPVVSNSTNSSVPSNATNSTGSNSTDNSTVGAGNTTDNSTVGAGNATDNSTVGNTTVGGGNSTVGAGNTTTPVDTGAAGQEPQTSGNTDTSGSGSNGDSGDTTSDSGTVADAGTNTGAGASPTTDTSSDSTVQP